MIRLTRTIEHELTVKESFVVKIVNKNFELLEENEAISKNNGNFIEVITKYGKFKFENIDEPLSIDEVLIIFTEVNKCQRFFRPSATINTILLTEECDQLCIMCSQPPKNKRYDHFDLFYEAAMLIPFNSTLGISGGEPTLLKKNLFKFLNRVIAMRNDIRFHILSNCQHIENEDIKILAKLSKNILWGIPVYSHIPQTHDTIVGKKGSFVRVMESFNYFIQTGSRVELRTVLLQQNYEDLPKLSEFITTHLNWIEFWAIMQLENFGYAKMNWDRIFFDNSKSFENLGYAINTISAKRMNVSLYNFPLCTIPDFYRKYAVRSISDWKQKYLDECTGCVEKDYCGGFFEWYNKEKGYNKIGLRKS